MDRDRWHRIQALFHSAADLSPAEQASFLNDQSGDDQALKDSVRAMLDQDARGGSLLDRDVAQVASEMLDGAPAPIKEFGPYRIKKVIGEGGVGVVFLAERTDLGNLVAIKTLRDAWLSPARRQRFAAEQRMLAQLNHPSIARLYDAGTLPDGTPWFAMEYVDGLSLTDYCQTHQCSIEQRLKLFRAVCEAVQYAHQRTLIHRDLKPSNALVTKEGSVRLLDFGIAKHLDLEDAPADQTRTGIRLMTPAYAAPEQIRGEKAAIQTDIYSLGVMLYELLTGRLPFDLSHKTSDEAATMILTVDPPKPSTVGRDATSSWADLDVLCLTAMHRDPQRRYASAEALIRDIDHYLKRESLEARRDGAGYRLGRFLRRNRQGMAVAAGVTLVMALGGALLFTVTRKTVSPNPSKRTVAVLPFQNAGPDHSLDFLSFALADELATTLSYTRSLSLRPFATTRKYVGADVDLARAGSEMQVSTIVTGHFLRSRDQLQITLEAVDLQTNQVLRRDRFDVPVENLIAMQTQIASRVRGGLAPVLGGSGMANGTPHAPNSEKGYDLFLRSTAFTDDPGPNEQAIEMLEKAVKLDPDYAPAWVSLGLKYYAEAHYGNAGDAAIERSTAALERARALDPDSIDAGSGLVINRVERGELVKGYREAQDLLRRRPDNARALFSLSYVLRYTGLLDEAASRCDDALSLDPQAPGLRSCGVVFLLRGNYPRAMDFIQLTAGSEWTKILTVDALVRQHKEQEALGIPLARAPQWAGFDMLLGCVAHRPAAEIADMARTIRPVADPEDNYFAADHLTYCGQTDAALQMLRRAVERHYCSYPAIDSDPLLANIRNRPEFREIRAAAINCRNEFLTQRAAR